MQRKRLKLDGYVRVSRVGGRSGDSFISPDVQREQIGAWAASRGHEMVEWHEDLDQSGGTIARPAFQAALRRIEEGEVDGLVVAKLDRFARSIPRAWDAIERIEAAGGTFASVADDLDLSTSSGRLMFNMLGSVAQFERDRITETWDTSNRRAIERGVHFTNRPPFGYARGADKRLTPDPKTAPLVVEAFRRRALRGSRRRIADYLNGTAPRDGGRVWTPASVGAIIRNRAYLGEAFHGKHRNADAHPALVTLAEWEAANSVTGGPGAVHAQGSLLAGVIRCAGCRYAMRRTFVRYRDGSRVELYACQVAHTGGRCGAPAKIIAHVVEPVVVGHFLTVSGGVSWDGRTPDDGALEAARRQLEHAEGRLQAFLQDDELRGVVGRGAFLAQAQERQAAVDGARAEFDAAKSGHYLAERRSYMLGTEWPAWDRTRQADALRDALDAVYVRKGRGPAEDRVLILWEGEDVYERPRRGTTEYRTKPIPWPRPPARFPGDADDVVEAADYGGDPLFLRVPGNARRFGIGDAAEALAMARALHGRVVAR